MWNAFAPTSDLHPIYRFFARWRRSVLFWCLWVPFCFSVLTCLPLSLRGQDNQLQLAHDHAQANRFDEALAIYRQVLETSPRQVEALVGLGYLLSWRGEQDAAQAAFHRALAVDAALCDAMVGLGFSYSWTGDIAAAKEMFRRGLACSPGRTDAQKGLAAAALLSGELATAEAAFRKIAAREPENADVHASLGQALFQRGRYRASKRAFRRALALSPSNQKAMAGLSLIDDLPSSAELVAWGGLSDADDERALGIRNVEIGIWPARTTRIWARFDQSLALDNVALIRSGFNARTWSVGALQNWQNRGIYSKVEFGKIRLPGGVSNSIFQLEQIYPVAEGYAVRAGGVLYAGSNADVWNAYTGLRIPLHSSMSLEPMVFYTSFTETGSSEIRYVLTGENRLLQGVSATWGLYRGVPRSAAAPNGSSISGAFAFLSISLAKHQTAFFLVRRESGMTTSQTISAIGLKIGLPR